MKDKLTDTGVKQTIDLDKISADPNQPRKDMGDIEELAKQIDAVGLIQPPLVRPSGEYPFDSFIIIAGERRITAMKLLGWKTTDAIVHDISKPAQILTLQIMENRGRKDMDVLETARGYARLREHYNSAKEMSEEIGVGQAEISRLNKIINAGELTLALAAQIHDVNALATFAKIESQSPVKAKHLVSRLKVLNFEDARTHINAVARNKHTATEVRKTKNRKAKVLKKKGLISGEVSDIDVVVNGSSQTVSFKVDGVNYVFDIPKSVAVIQTPE